MSVADQWRRLLGALSRVASIDGPIIPPRSGVTRRNPISVTPDTALRHSAVWAALRLRASLMSSFPVDVFRRVPELRLDFEVAKPPMLVAPGGERWDWVDWMYASQIDLDRAGNDIGIITEKNALGLPARIDLQAISDCTVIQRRDMPEPEYRIAGKKYTADQVWHERQYVVAGLPVGLSPIAYAALSVGEYLSIQQFVNEWFGGGAVPKARLRHKERTVPRREAALIKEQWNESVVNGDLFVTGNEWEYDLMQAEQVATAWLDARRFGLADVARFLDVTADLIEAAISAPGSLTYQTAVTKNLQFLIFAMGPAVQRREKNISKWLPRPRFIKLNTNALLRMDPKTQAEMLHLAITDRRMTVTEARELDNRPPLTPEQEAEFVRLFGAPKAAPEPAVRSGELLPPWGWEPVNPLSAAPSMEPEGVQ